MRRAAQLKSFASSNGITYVESDNDHTFKTAQFFKGNVQPRFRRAPESVEDEKVQDWYAVGDENQIVPDQSERFAHIQNTGEVLTLKLIPLTLNRSIKSLLIEPQTTVNFQECKPSTQVDILPYVTDSVVHRNLNVQLGEYSVPNDDFQNVFF